MAQLVARDVWDVDAAGSNPVTPTKNPKGGNAPLWAFSIAFDGEDPLLFAEKDRFALR